VRAVSGQPSAEITKLMADSSPRRGSISLQTDVTSTKSTVRKTTAVFAAEKRGRSDEPGISPLPGERARGVWMLDIGSRIGGEEFGDHPADFR
jgi:hypothetical protein